MKVCDMHCDTISIIDQEQLNGNMISIKDNDLNISLDKMIKGDYLLQNFAVFTPLTQVDDPMKYALHLIDTFYQEIEQYPDLIKPIKSYQDIENNMNNHIMSAMLTLEEGAVVNNDIAHLRNYYRLGVRMITLTWNYVNGIGHPNFDMNDPRHGYHCYDDQNGLTEFGLEYIKECERLGIIIDVSHLSDKGFYDVYENTTLPFVASHSDARSVTAHARNMSDDMILKLASRGGVMGINFASGFLNEADEYSYVEDMVKHIIYIRDLAGIDVIGLGTDFDGIKQNLELKDASYMPKLYQALKENHFSEEDIEKIFYKNVLNLYKKVLK